MIRSFNPRTPNQGPAFWYNRVPVKQKEAYLKAYKEYMAKRDKEK